MAGFGQTTRKDLLNFIFRGTALTGKAAAGVGGTAGSFYVALYTADPGTDGAGGTEVSGGSYAAQNITTTTFGSNATDNTTAIAEIANTVAVTFPTASASWGTVTHAAIYSHATTRSAATFLGANTLGASQAVANGNTFSFPIGTLKIQLTSA